MLYSFHSFFEFFQTFTSDSITRQKNGEYVSYFLQKTSRGIKGKQLVCFDHQNVNYLCLRLLFAKAGAGSVFPLSHRNMAFNQSGLFSDFKKPSLKKIRCKMFVQPFSSLCFYSHFHPARLQALESGLKSKVTWSLSNDVGNAEDDAYSKMDLYSTFEFRNCPDLFSKHMALKTCSG